MANSISTIVGLNQLNTWMRDTYSGIIVDTEFIWRSAWDTLRERVDSRDFQGNLVEIEMQTDFDFSGRANGERVTLPYAGAQGYTKMQLPLKEVIVPAGITQQALDRATGPPGAWGKIVDREVDQCRNMRLPWLMETCVMGNGTGALARTMGTDDSGSPVASGYIRICCDNTYIDWGTENVRMIRKGGWIEIYNASGGLATDGSGVTSWKVTKVWFGDRDNGVAVTPATTSGSEVACFEIQCTAGQEATIAAYANNSGVVYTAGTRSVTAKTPDSVDGTNKHAQLSFQSGTVTTSLPMGLLGIYQTTDADFDYSDGSLNTTLDTFQGLTRSSYETLNTRFENGATISGGSGTAGTPGDWDFSTISNTWMAVENDTGAEIDLFMCSGELSTCMDRKNPITITTDTVRKSYQPLRGAQYAKPFLAPNGNMIPVIVSKSIPKNVLYGITTKHLHWYVKGGFDWKLKGGGDIWILSPGNRVEAYEAWFGGYTQLACERADGAFVMQDMADNVA